MSAEGSHKAIFAAAGANLTIAVAKVAAWALTGSSAMLAEGIHSVADTGNQGLLLLGSKRAAKAPDDEHNFGYSRARYLYAFVVSIVLFLAGGCFALYEAYDKFVDPHPITSWRWVPVLVLLISIVAEGTSLRTALAEAKALRGNQSLMGYIRSSRAPEIPVVMLEDIAALTGLVFALGGVGVTLATGNGRWDAVGSAAIGVLLIVVAAFLASEMASLLLGESVTPKVEKLLRAGFAQAGLNLIYLKTLHLGPEQVLVAAKIAVAEKATGKEISQHINAAESIVRQSLPKYELAIFIEPDLSK